MLFLRCTEHDKSQQREVAARETSVIRKKILHRTLNHIVQRAKLASTPGDLQNFRKKKKIGPAFKWEVIICDYDKTPFHSEDRCL